MEDDYKDHYSDDGVFGSITYSSPGVSRGLALSLAFLRNAFFEIKGRVKILVVGAGHGYEIINYIKAGHSVRGIDLYAPPIKMVQDVTHIGSAEDMPYDDNEFDFVHCTEMLEHIPEEITNDVLNECKRVGKRFLFSIATREDPPYNTHINVHPAWWWLKKFDDLGFETLNASYAPRVLFRVGRYASRLVWHDGVLLYGQC